MCCVATGYSLQIPRFLVSTSRRHPFLTHCKTSSIENPILGPGISRLDCLDIPDLDFTAIGVLDVDMDNNFSDSTWYRPIPCEMLFTDGLSRAVPRLSLLYIYYWIVLVCYMVVLITERRPESFLNQCRTLTFLCLLLSLTHRDIITLFTLKPQRLAHCYVN